MKLSTSNMVVQNPKMNLTFIDVCDGKFMLEKEE
jgi:hypothetical protein